MIGPDPILDQLAIVHRAALAAGQAHLDGDTAKILDELDKATAAAVAVGAQLRQAEEPAS